MHVRPRGRALEAGAVDSAALGRLVIVALAVMGSPGPATVSLVAAGAAHGVRRSLGFLAGLIVGTWAVLAAVAAGITAVLVGVPALRDALTAVAGAYILWLAYRLATAPSPASGAAAAPAPTLAGGLALAVANPKGWIAIAATFASARLAGSAVGDAAAKAAVLSGMVVAILTGWLLGGAALAPLLRGPRSRAVHVVLAAVLVGATAWALLR